MKVIIFLMQKSTFFQLALVSCFLLFSHLSFAIEYGGFGGRPAFPRADNPRTESIFVHTLEPGVVQQEGIIVINNSTESKTVLVYAADSTPSTGWAFACKQFSEERADVGSWINLTKGQITLAPGVTQTIPFAITVPENVSVGEHNGCILIQEKKPKKDGQPGVNLSIRTGLRVAITVPGDIERKLEIAGFDYKRQKWVIMLQPQVKNIGNVSIDADVSVITRHFFWLKYSTQGGEYPILRSETSDWNFDLKKPFLWWLYRSTFTVSYDPSPEAQIGNNTDGDFAVLRGPNVWFFAMPSLLGFLALIVIVAFLGSMIFLFVVARRRQQWILDYWNQKKLTQNTDITTLANEYNVSWKLLASVNRLKPPYALKKGDTIKVPPHK